ncbi:MAG: response regulator [Clostridia bacterium]|nr:response regulator [Clostridia bacterium]
MVNVLIADDNFVFAKKLMDYINTNDKVRVIGISVDGEEALNKLNTNDDIDIILLDLKMPKYSGIEVLKKINKVKREKYKDCCIVISGEMDLINQLWKDEMIHTILPKALGFNEIKNEILKLVNQKQHSYNEDKIKSELLYLGYDISHKGTIYLLEAIQYISNLSGYELGNLKKDIYPYIAEINRTSIHNVKCNIARATENMYYNCDANRLKEYFKLQEVKKPNIKTIIQTILYRK